jgi:hypothetical protein
MGNVVGTVDGSDTLDEIKDHWRGCSLCRVGSYLFTLLYFYSVLFYIVILTSSLSKSIIVLTPASSWKAGLLTESAKAYSNDQPSTKEIERREKRNN